MLRVPITIIFLGLWSSIGLAKNIDSLQSRDTLGKSKAKALSDYAFVLADHNPDSAILLARAGLKIAVATNDNLGFASAYDAIGWSYFRLGKHDSAKLYLEKSKNIFHAQHDIEDEVRALTNIANIYQAEQNYEVALTQLLVAMKISESTDETEHALAEKMLGIIYRKLGNLIQAKLYIKRASDNFLRLHKPTYYADALSSLGIVYHDLGKIDSASYCYHIALEIDLKEKNLSGAALAYEDLAEIAFTKSNAHEKPLIDSALYYYRQAYNTFSVLKDIQDMAFEKMTMSQILINKKKYSLAQKYLKESLVVFSSSHDLNNVYNTLTLLNILYNAMHNYSKAYDFLKEADLYKDTLNQQNEDKAIADILAKYETEKKDRTIALLNVQNSLLNTKKQLAEHSLYKTRITEIFSLVLIILSIFLTLVLWNRYSIKQKLKEMELRNRISNDLHDDVGSSLSSILLLSNIAADADMLKPELVSKISENARDAIERISDIIWTTNPKYDDGENLRSKIINYIAPLCQMHNIAFQVNISEIIKNIKFQMETRKNIFLIIKEALNNIFKHARASEISLDLFIKERNLVIEIRDNGKGFDNNNSFNGNGLRTMLSRTRALGGELHLDTQPERGTKILITLPISKTSIVQ